MPKPAIIVEGLSKRYHIGARQNGRKTFREALMEVAGAPFRRLRAFGRSSDRDDDIIWALKDVSFEVQPGEVVGIIGRNGAGKSTLLKILTRITEPTEGRAVLNGRVSSLLEVGTGFHSELTGRENVYLSGAILGMKKREIDAKFDEIVDFSGVEKFIDTPVKRYSSGMTVRLGFAVAAHLEPDILLVDEVLAVGDAEFQKKCLAKMAAFAEGERAIIFVSHNLHHIRTLCQRALLVDKGSIIETGSAGRVVSCYKSAHVWGGPSATREVDPSMIIRIREVRFVSGGVPISVVRTGQDLLLELTYEATVSIRAVGFTVGFYGVDGVLSSGYSTAMDSLDVPVAAGAGCARILFPELGMEPGTYAVSVGVWDARCLVPYDWHQHAYPLLVEEERPVLGNYRLAHTWSFAKDMSRVHGPRDRSQALNGEPSNG